MGTFAQLGIPFPLFDAPVSHAMDFEADATCSVCGKAHQPCFKARPRSINRQPKVDVCYKCLREGKAAIFKSTEFGMVGWLEALRGLTGGVPGLHTAEFETEQVSEDDGGWYGAKIPSAHLLELLRTPTYSTWQGDSWLFCCQAPMCYLGEWNSLPKPGKFSTPRAFFDAVIRAEDPHKERVWRDLELRKGATCLHVFACKKCGRYRSHWEYD